MNKMSILLRNMVIFGGMICALTAKPEVVPEPSWLRDELVAVRKKYELPAIAAAVVKHGEIIAASAVGYRKLGNFTQVTRDDPFLLGSITKPMTATMVGLYVDEKVLDWDTTMAQMFPELVPMMKPAYREVTVAQLLSHTSGLPYQPHTPDSVTDKRATGPVGQRYEYVKVAVQDEPEATPGTKTIYSGGAIIVASFLERKLATSYEQMMHDRIFTKLQMNRAGFGCMATEGKVDGPWEHVWKNGEFVPIAPSAAQRQKPRNPVGGIHCSVMDLARFAALHLDGARGRSQFLSTATFQRLHTPMPGGRFAPGFVIESETWLGKQTIWHSGSNGRNYAGCTIGVERDIAICMMTNAGGGPADKACGEVQSFVGDYLKALEGTPTGEFSSGQVAKPDAAERLKQIKALLDQGLISQEVYDQKRKEILDSL
jgi:CubicO group peptidase (beta-lactamase class C family)